MGLDLTTQYIDETFQKLVQVSGSNLTNGTGSVITELTVTASNANFALTANQAVTATFANTSTSASYAANATNAVSASTSLYANTAGTATSATTATSASHALNADNSISSSYAVSAGNSLTSNTSISASHANVADLSISSSYAIVAGTSISSSHALYANNAGTVNGLTIPTTGQADAELLRTDGAGNLTWDFADRTVINIKNVDTVALPLGTPVYITSIQGSNLYLVKRAASNSSITMPAIGLVRGTTSLAVNGQGQATLSGVIRNINTSTPGWLLGQKLYVGATGGLTNVRPVGSNLIQSVAVVGSVGNNGHLVVTGAGRSNDVPNLPTGTFWIGNGTQNAVTVNTGSFAKLSVNNTFTGIQTFDTITANSASFGYLQTVTGSATIIGDSIIVLNNDTPTQRYAGIAVYDSGSTGVTASLEFDGQTNDWFYEYSTDGGVTTDHGVAMFGPEYSVKGSPVYPTTNTILKGNGHHVEDSSITDNGASVVISSSLLEVGGVANPFIRALDTLGNKTETFARGFTTQNTANTTVGVGTDFGGYVNPFNAGGRDIAIALDTTQFGAGDWTAGPAITNEVGGGTWPTVIGFDGPGGFGDNRVSFLTPVSASAGITGNLTGNASTATSASYASLAENLTSGNKTHSGYIQQTFNAPALNNQIEILSPQNCSIGGVSYSNVFFGVADYSGFGTVLEDYFSIEYYDSFGYNYGTEVNINGINARFAQIPNGGGFGQLGELGIVDNGDTTNTAYLKAGKIEIGNGITTKITLQGKTVGNSLTVTEVVGGNSDVDFSKGNFFILSMTGNSTLRPINIDSTSGVGQTVSVRVATGGNTLSFDSSIKWQDGTAPTLTGTAVVTFVTFSGDNVVYATSVNNLS